MKYLNSYRLFEVSSIFRNDSIFYKNTELTDDIKDILTEVEDGDRIKTSLTTTNGKCKNYISFYLSGKLDYDSYRNGFNFNEISDYVFRLKSYLGGRLKSCSILLSKDVDEMNHFTNRINLNLENEKELINKLDGLAIENLIMEINNI